MTDNKLIAEFMGITTDPLSNRTTAHFGNKELKYDTSWDWLKPVVDKILHTTSPKDGEGWSYEYIELDKTRIGNNIQYVYQRVVAYIKWYTTQNPKQG